MGVTENELSEMITPFLEDLVTGIVRMDQAGAEEIHAQNLGGVGRGNAGEHGRGARGGGASTLTQEHELIRDADEYADLFAHAAAVTATSTLESATANTTTNNTNNAPGIQP